MVAVSVAVSAACDNEEEVLPADNHPKVGVRCRRTLLALAGDKQPNMMPNNSVRSTFWNVSFGGHRLAY